MRILALFLTLLPVAWMPSLQADQTEQAPRMTLSPETRDRALSILRTALRSDAPATFWVSMHAAEGLTLGGYGDELKATLEAKLSTDNDAQHRCGIARELVRAGHPEHLATLSEVLRSPDPYGHIHAAESLFKVYEVGDEAVMRERFERGDSLKLRLMAAAALARKFNDPKAYAFIRESVIGEDPDGLQIGSWILGVIGDRSDIPRIKSRLSTAPSPLIHAYLVNALACLGDSEGLDLLIENLSDPDPVIRAYAATFAGDARAILAQSHLEALLADTEADVRVRAAQTLLQLSQ